MSKVVTKPLSPWLETAQRAFRLGGGYDPLFLIGSPGSLQIECAREIHESAGSGTFERVICTSDSVELRTQLFGHAPDPHDEYSALDPEPPVGAIHRSTGGTLFLESVDRCRPVDADWIPKLLARQQVTINRYPVALDPSTRVIASITTDWMDRIEHELPQWLKAIFDDRVLLLEPLESRPDRISVAVEWLFWRASKSRDDNALLSREAKDLLVSRQWPGNYEELGNVVNSIVSNAAAGEVITADTCERVLTIFDSIGMGAVDRNRRQQCRNYALGLTYMGRSIDAREVYQWAAQFSKVSRDRRFDPWLPSLRIAKEIAHRYYYSSDRLRKLTRNAYWSLCVELAEKNYITDWFPTSTEGSLPRLHTVLINSLGPIKSSSVYMPHIAHLLGIGYNQQVSSISEVANCLARNKGIRMIMFCDDFTGTGQQILSRFIEVLAADELLREVCENRRQEGTPLAFGVVLGVGFDDALQKIRTSGPDWLPIMAHAGEQLGEQDRAFSDSSRIFPEPDLRAWAKDLVIDQVGKHLVPKWPGGYDDLQSLVVTADNVPNNSLPAIYSSGSVQEVKWHALFERASTPLK